MTTSALALLETLSAVAERKNPKGRFRTALAECLGLEGEEGELQAVLYLYKLTARVRDDIEVAEINSDNKRKLKGYLTAFNGILSLSQMTQTIGKLKETLLKPDHLTQLTWIHMALDGKVNRYDGNSEVKDLISSIDEIREAVADSSLPSDLKKALLRRLTELRSAVDHFRFYGIEGLEDTLSMLVGEVLTKYTQEQIKENPQVFGGISKTVKSALRWIYLAKNAVRGSRELVEEVPKAFEAIENLTKM